MISLQDIIAASEQRLTKEVDALVKERQSQNTLLVNLQSIQNNLKRTEFDVQQRLQSQVDSLSKEITFVFPLDFCVAQFIGKLMSNPCEES